MVGLNHNLSATVAWHSFVLINAWIWHQCAYSLLSPYYLAIHATPTILSSLYWYNIFVSFHHSPSFPASQSMWQKETTTRREAGDKWAVHVHEQLDPNCRRRVSEAGTGSMWKRQPLAPVASGSVAAPDNGQGSEDTSKSSHPLILNSWKLAELHYVEMAREE